MVPVTSSNIGKAQYLLAGTLTSVDASSAAKGTFRINLSLTDIRTGFVVAQAVARARADAVDTTPTAFYRDSPSLTKDRIVEGQIRTAQTPTGQAADEVYLSRLPISALITEGSRLYEAGNYAEALRYYESAAARPEGQQLRVFNGLYLTYTQLGRRRGKSVRENRRAWSCNQQPVGQVPLPPGFRGFSGGSESQRPLQHVASRGHPRSRHVGDVPHYRRPHEQNRNGTIQRQAVDAKSRHHPNADRSPGARNERTAIVSRRGLSREPCRIRHR